MYLVDTISHLREPSHAPACPTPGCPSHRPRPALHPPRLAQRHRQVSARRCAQGHPRRPGGRRTGRPARPWRRRESDPPLPTRTLRRLDRRTGRTPLLMQAGAFGENFSTSGWSEADVCLGDRVRAGTALLEVSQGRMPCWKLNDRFEVAGMSLRVQESGRTGWYYRVLEEGVVAAGDILQLVERRHPDWSLLRLSEVLFDRRADAELLRQCLALPLTPSWRRTLERRLEKGQVEDWGPRLEGAPARPRRPGRPEEAPTPPTGRESAWGCMECRKAGIKRQR
ncbi:MOSC domain-containing protein [Pseudomonas aeruginosa]|nr:MOSC domain-containing protein [Pseudomonas aeruginosa]